MLSLLFFFFFQAEDGIRDRDVTGVQTCALPICDPARRPLPRLPRLRERVSLRGRVRRARRGDAAVPRALPAGAGALRSEERRVGKECRTRRSRDEYKENDTCNVLRA